MHNVNQPPLAELPSATSLMKSTLLAAGIAMLLLFTVVLPAEYGIDPTGLGSVTGLTRMGEIKVALAREEAEEAAQQQRTASAAALTPAPTAPSAPAPAAPVTPAAPVIESAPVTNPAPVAAPTLRSDQMQVTLAPGEGTEIKVTLAAGKTVNYRWESSGGPANFDVHGDSVPLNIEYQSYSRGVEQRSEGVLQAAFDGNHGWFWRNRTTETITITLDTSGEYTDIKHLE